MGLGGFASQRREMVVLDEHQVEQTEAVIVSAAAGDRVFFKAPPAGRGFARVEDFRARAFDRRHKLRGKGGHPESRWMKFSATRSALRIARAGPETFNKTSPAFTRRPSLATRRMRTPGESLRNAASAKARPATTNGSRARMTAPALARSGTVAKVVTSPRPMSSAKAACTALRISAAVSEFTTAEWPISRSR